MSASTPHVDLVRAAAEIAGVCARPVVSRVTDIDTGDVRVVPISCGATRASKCVPCAERAKRLRMRQCREGWHLTDEPPAPAPPDEDEDQADDEPETDRRVRSTARRQDAPDLPKVPME